MVGTSLRPVVFACAVALATASDALAAPQWVAEVTTSALNVRDAAGGALVGAVSYGDRLVVTGQSGSWLSVDFGARTGWLSASYVRRTTDRIALVTADAANVRRAPSTAAERLATVSRGRAYVVHEAGADWVRVQLDHRAAWVHRSLVTLQDLGGAARNPASSVSQADLEVLARIIKGEALQCSFEGKVAVAAVVLNRVRSARFPNTIRGVAHQPLQFSCYNPNVRNRLYWGPVPQSCWDAARAAVAGQDPSRGADHYFNPYLVQPSWRRTMTFLVRIGTNANDTHDFYRSR